MHIKQLRIENFRAIDRVVLTDLSDVVVIAGPNGSGKSAILDAIRLFKSVYGGYQPNEWQHWMSEFQINVGTNPEQFLSLLQDKGRCLRIFAELNLSDSEREWLRSNAFTITRNAIWRQVAPEVSSWRYLTSSPLAAQLRTLQPEVDQRTAIEAPQLIEDLKASSFHGELCIETDGTPRTERSTVLERVFSLYEPHHVGIIDYHGPQRTYAREQIGGVNLSIETSEQQLSQHALYNYQNKYSNIKSELAAAYIRDLIAEQTGNCSSDTKSLVETLKELFVTFFPGKEFMGPEPTPSGALLFNVRTQTGALHDINDLSSGEKEVLYGYLRLRSESPRDSVLLIDEPELHPNPRLIQGLPQFYHRHLGQALDNQLWLVTHSDALLRQAVGLEGFKVFHMQPAGTPGAEQNQVREIRASDEVERAIIDLVGDLAVYRPGAKAVVLEGGGDSEFDVRMVATLFPRFEQQVNLLSGGNKARVRELHALLERTGSKAGMPVQFYSIADRDFGDEQQSAAGRILCWDRFHIENYLLESRFLREVIRDLGVRGADEWSEEEIERRLRQCAELTLPSLVRYFLQDLANKKLLGTLRTTIDPNASDVSAALEAAIKASEQRMGKVIAYDLARPALQALEEERTTELHGHLADGRWRWSFRGRDILRRFVDVHLSGAVSYEVFRNLVLSRMRDAEFEPEGMQKVIDYVLADPRGE